MTTAITGGAARAASPVRVTSAFLFRAAAAAVALHVFVTAGGAAAQDASPWSGSGQLSLQHSTGTSTYTSVTAAHDLTYARRLHVELHTGYTYARSSFTTQQMDGDGTLRTVTQRDDRRSAIADLLLRYPGDGRVYGVARGVAEHDENQNIERRLHGAIGAGTYVWRRPRHSLQSELSAGRISERDTHSASIAYTAVSALLDHELGFGARGGSASSRLEWAHAITGGHGALLRGRFTLYAPFTERLGINVSYSVLHDTEAAGLFDPGSDDEVVSASARTTTSLSLGLRVGW